MVWRCETCNCDVYPVGAQCVACGGIWCVECARVETIDSSFCSEVDVKYPVENTCHRIRSLTFLRHDLATKLSTLIEKVPDPTPSSPPTPPATLSVADISHPVHGDTRKDLKYQTLKNVLVGQAKLVHRIDPRSENAEAEIERYLEHGEPAVVEVGAEGWGQEEACWDEMKKVEGKWTVLERGKLREEEGELEGYVKKVVKGQKCRLQDFPADKRFSHLLPEPFKAFEKLLLHPQIMSSAGALNLSSSLYRIEDPPDLGPKWYGSYLSEHTPAHGVSTPQPCLNSITISHTRFHPFQDAGDAANIALTLFRLLRGKAPVSDIVAYWVMIPARFKDKVCKVLKNAGIVMPFFGFAQDGLTAEILGLLLDEGIEVQVSPQKIGEMVIIPAGCLHEVINVAPAVKGAVDFVVPSSLQRCQELLSERRERYAEEKAGKVDLVRIPASTVAFAVEALKKPATA